MEVKIIPTGGLCNRLRAIDTRGAVAKSYHCPSVIYWNNSHLSKTKKIIGSVGSSYSQIAAEIGGIEVEYAK